MTRASLSMAEEMKYFKKPSQYKRLFYLIFFFYCSGLGQYSQWSQLKKESS